MTKLASESRPVPRSLPRGRHGLSRELVCASQRLRLMDAMVELTAKLGYAGVTIGLVVSRARVAKRTFYEHFADKEECFLAAGEHLAEQIAQTIASTNPPGPKLHQGTRAGMGGLLELLAKRPSYARAFVMEVWAAGPRLINWRLEVERQLALLLVSLSPDAHAGQPNPVTETHAAAVVEAIDGHIYRIVYSEGAAALPKHAEALTQMAITLLMADIPRPRRAGRDDSPTRRGSGFHSDQLAQPAMLESLSALPVVADDEI